MKKKFLEDKTPKRLFWSTLGVLLIFAIGSLFYLKKDPPPSIVINTKGQPTIGYAKAKVHVVVFEEPKCVNCKSYNDEVAPKLKEDFINNNKILYTVIPVSFLPGSMQAAISFLCVYYAEPMYPNSDLFFTYLDYVYKHQPSENTDWTTMDRLIEYARLASPAIDTAQLKTCTEKSTYRIQIEKNNSYGAKIMGGNLATPTVYVNGRLVEDLSYHSLKKLIQEELEQQGIY